MSFRGLILDLPRRISFAVRSLRSLGLNPVQVRLVWGYLSAHVPDPPADIDSLQAAVQWLKRASDRCGEQGVSTKFSLRHGWDRAYPETTGYIIPSLYMYGETFEDADCVRRAIALGDWEIAIQRPSGGVLSNLGRDDTRVFNTGQVLLGWCFLHEKTGELLYRDAASRAVEYLIARQESDGSWVRDTYCGARTYHARVAWALLRAAHSLGDERGISPAIKSLSWVLRRQRANGWFDCCGFHEEPPNLHVIAYTLRGLLECAVLGARMGLREIDDQDLIERVCVAVNMLMATPAESMAGGTRGLLPAAFDAHWRPASRTSCLTGNLQLACVLYRLFALSGRRDYQTYADTLTDATRRTQRFGTGHPGIDGAVPGSHPIYSGYLHSAFPNWATKFLVDALLMKMDRTGSTCVPA